MKNSKRNLSSFFLLFTSLSTLICCALPVLLVALGLGAVVASTISAVPFLIPLSKNKDWLFLIAFLVMGINFYMLYGRKRRTCEVQSEGTETACDVASRWNKVLLWVMVVILSISSFKVYLAMPILKFLGLL